MYGAAVTLDLRLDGSDASDASDAPEYPLGISRTVIQSNLRLVPCRNARAVCISPMPNKAIHPKN